MLNDSDCLTLEKNSLFKHLSSKMKKSRTITYIKCWCSYLILLSSNILHAQTTSDIRDSINLRNNVSLELTGSMLPPGKVKNTEGEYCLHSKLQSSFSASLYYNIEYVLSNSSMKYWSINCFRIGSLEIKE
jgi:hypothetical protein